MLTNNAKKILSLAVKHKTKTDIVYLNVSINDKLMKAYAFG